MYITFITNRNFSVIYVLSGKKINSILFYVSLVRAMDSVSKERYNVTLLRYRFG